MPQPNRLLDSASISTERRFLRSARIAGSTQITTAHTIRQRSLAFPHLLAVLLVASRATGEIRVRPAGLSRTVTTSPRIEFRSAQLLQEPTKNIFNIMPFLAAQPGARKRRSKKLVVSLRRPYFRPDDLRLQASRIWGRGCPSVHWSPDIRGGEASIVAVSPRSSALAYGPQKSVPARPN